MDLQRKYLKLDLFDPNQTWDNESSSDMSNCYSTTINNSRLPTNIANYNLITKNPSTIRLITKDAYSNQKLNDCKRRNSSGQKLAKFLNILVPSRNRTARRSRSFGDLSKKTKCLINDKQETLNIKFNNSNSQVSLFIDTLTTNYI